MEFKEQKINEIRNQMDEILIDLEHRSRALEPLHEVEGSLFQSLLRLGLALLGYYIGLVERGLKPTTCSIGGNGERLVDKGISARRYRSVFGLLVIERRKYWSKGLKTYYPLDEALGLGLGRYSYLLQDWLAYGSVEMDFTQSAGLVHRILGQDLSAMQASRCTYRMSEHVEAYYEQDEKQVQAAFTHLSLGYDGKGIPIRRSQTLRSQDSSASRLAKGKKKDVKREATLSLSSTFNAQSRDPEDLIDALFNADSPKTVLGLNNKSHKWHQDKHIRAFLSDKPKAIAYGLNEALAKDPSAQKPIVVLIDGAPSLENTIKKLAAQKQIEHRIDAYVLDFFHLLEYVWKVANAHLGEKHPKREHWVKQQARLLLNSQTHQVLKQWKYILSTKTLSQYKKTLLKRSIKYLQNRPHMIDYKAFLLKGYPITTGAVESACGHFIKCRMNRNAMHWGKKGAQQMLDIRAVKKNQDWNAYIQFFIQQQQQRIFPIAA